jgi:DNA-binding CsgD family transcriptional regulator
LTRSPRRAAPDARALSGGADVLVDPEGVVGVSDFLDPRELRRTLIYARVYSRLSVTRELFVTFPSPDAVACLAVYRSGRDFTPHERARFGFVRAPLITAIRLVSQRTPLPDDLTARESQVLAELVTGATPGQIAVTLDVSRRTVHKHLEHVYRKLGVTYAGAAVARTLGTGQRGGVRASAATASWSSAAGRPAPTQPKR